MSKDCEPKFPPRVFVIIEVDRKTCKHVHQHHLILPNVCDKGGYVQISSYNAFTTGKRKGKITEYEKKNYLDGCCYSPTKLYISKSNREFLMFLDIEKKYFEKLKESDPDWRFDDELPKTTYYSIFDFYKAIGFDHKKRKYI